MYCISSKLCDYNFREKSSEVKIKVMIIVVSIRELIFI